MMNFEERKAEIFRRSDERIKTRKRNAKRILLSCMSLVIFVSVISAVAAYPLTKESMSDGTWGMDGLSEDPTISANNYSLAYPIFVELTDLDSGENRNIEGCSRIIAVTDILFSITEGRDRLDSYGICTETTDSDLHKDKINKSSYEIIITREPPDEEIKINAFILNGNTLTDKDTEQEYLLSDDDLEALLTALESTEQWATIGYSTEYAKISLNFLDGWKYEINEPEGESDDFSISIWPYGHSDGKIRIEYSPYFGVCGTGLTEKKTTIGNYEASMGFYNNSKVWSFIALTGEAQRDYVIWNESADEWWSEYGIEAMAILDTLLVGSDVTDTNN